MPRSETRVRVLSDGTPGGTAVWLDGQQVSPVRILWDIGVRHCKLVLEFDGEPSLELNAGLMASQGERAR